MSKYQPLGDHLTASGAARIRLSFEDIERIIGAPLPASAGIHSAWWANVHDPRHVQKRAWASAGQEVDQVDRARRWVRFKRR